MPTLYLHIPFCRQRCTYCDFYFVTTAGSHAPFLSALQVEIEHYAAEHGAKPFETLYFGGGTPSRLADAELADIFGALYQGFAITDDAEVTLEVNPDDASVDYLRGLRALGVNRLSIGIQSFYDDDLRFMNRAHDAEQSAAVVEMARAAGFDNFSVDLIFGLPDQPAEYWAANLQRVVEAGVPHVSAYSLTVEDRTVLGNQVRRGLVKPLTDEAMAERFRFTMDYLREHGYEQYEISNYALPGFRSQHNSRYWDHTNYLGFGPSAHSFWRRGLPRPSAQRWANVRNLKQYEALLQGHQLPIDFRETLSLGELADEYIMLQLRTSDGIALDRLENEYGVDLFTEKLDDLAWLENEEYIYPIRNSRLRLTDEGKRVADSVTARLLLEPSALSRF
ncbi:MAG TPA: radical SAM family heme chaperone HemW [Rhodothermales bacterium]